MKRIRPRRHLLVRVCAVIWLIGGTTQLLFGDDVDAIVSQGIALRRQGQDTEALAEFQKALRIQDKPRVRAQAALAEQALGLWEPAEQDLLTALSHPDDPWIKRNRVTLSGALTAIQSHLGSFEPWGTPAGAAVLVNAKPVGTLPLARPVRVSGNSVLLTVRAEGYLELQQSIRVSAGGVVREHVELIPAPPEAATPRRLNAVPATETNAITKRAMGTAVTDPNPESVERPQDESPVNQAPESRSSIPRQLAWATGVGAVSALTLGVVETISRSSKRDAFNNYALPNAADPGHPIPYYCSESQLPPQCTGLKNDFDRATTLMVVGYATAGALAMGSTVLFLLSSENGDTRSASTCVPNFGGPGLACRLVF